jgi:hypothetical protein
MLQWKYDFIRQCILFTRLSVLRADRRLSMEKTPGPVWAKMNILGKNGKFSFKIIGIGQAPVSVLHSRDVRNSINEKGN